MKDNKITQTCQMSCVSHQQFLFGMVKTKRSLKLHNDLQIFGVKLFVKKSPFALVCFVVEFNNKNNFPKLSSLYCIYRLFMFFYIQNCRQNGQDRRNGKEQQIYLKHTRHSIKSISCLLQIIMISTTIYQVSDKEKYLETYQKKTFF